MKQITPMNRRQFIKTSLTAAGGLTLGVYLGSAAAMEENEAAAPAADEATAKALADPNVFIRIAPDNTVTVIVKHLEMGQGTYTGLASLVADEMDASWEQIRAEAAPADAEKYKNLLFGMQGTGGSTAMANSFMQMREAGAGARAMLVAAAAAQWQVDAKEIEVRQGVVSHHSGKQASFGELADAAAEQDIPASVTLKTPDQFIYIGKNNLLRLDSAAKTDGSAQYTQDIQLPNMVTAAVMHPPQFGATVANVDDSAAKAIKGVLEVVTIPSGVAVLAEDFWSAKKGRDALQVEWDTSAAYTGSSEAEMARYREMAQQEGLEARREGDPDQALSEAAQTLEAGYEFPYLAHASMEPLNCVIDLQEDHCEIWNGNQLHTLDQGAVAKVTGLSPEQVKINTLFAGGSFGRRGNPNSDYIVEAAHIAKNSRLGRPVKMVWTRENDTQGGQYRPLFFHQLHGGLDNEGQLTAWKQSIVGQSIMTGTPLEMMVQNGIDSSSVEGSAEPYAIPNLRIGLQSPEVKVPVQWWRSVGHTHTGFATECFIDELAHAAGKDPVEFRKAMLKEHPRHLRVLELAAEKSGWGEALPANKGRGIALVKSFGSYVAEVAEVTVHEDKTFKVDKVTVAVDCGIAVNPDVIYAQMGGSVGFALSSILEEEITLKEGRVEQSNFHNYKLLRMAQMPQVTVHIVPSNEPPKGVGEPGVPPLGPAVANALFAATGKRIRKLPIGHKV